MVTSNAVAQLGKSTQIYAGSTYDGTEKTLNQSIRNFRYILIGLITNNDYDYILMPTDRVQNGTILTRSLFEASTFGQVTLPFPYQSTVLINFISDTKFKVNANYNNINWILKVYAIWGIN